MANNARMLHARLPDDATADLQRLQAATGKSVSAIVRDGIALLAQMTLGQDEQSARQPRLHGMASFASEMKDLGSNKQHLKGFGITKDAQSQSTSKK